MPPVYALTTSCVHQWLIKRRTAGVLASSPPLVCMPEPAFHVRLRGEEMSYCVTHALCTLLSEWISPTLLSYVAIELPLN